MTRSFRESQPDFSTEMALMEAIQALKIGLEPQLLILTHHYQRQEIVALGDCRGDSFGLSQRAAANPRGPLHRLLRSIRKVTITHEHSSNSPSRN